MNKPSPLVSKSPFVSEQYSALWEATMQCGKHAAPTRAGYSNANSVPWSEREEESSTTLWLRSKYTAVGTVPAVVDMLNRLGYKIIKVTE